MTELSDLERRLVAAVAAGDEVDLAGERDPGPEDMDSWGCERDVRAEVIRDILLGRLGGTADPRGVRLRGARVVGRLDLEGVRIEVLLRLNACDFTDAIRVRGAQLPMLSLSGSRLQSLHGRELTVERALLLNRVVVTGGVINLGGARIGTICGCEDTRLCNAAGSAFNAERMQIDGDLLLDRMVAEGAGEEGVVRLLGARIDGRLSARGIRLTNRSGPALVAGNLQVPDTVDFSHGTRLVGSGPGATVYMPGARVGSISFGQSELDNRDGPALAMHYAQVAGSVYLDRIQARGMVRLSGAWVGGQVEAGAAEIDGASNPAFDGTRLHVGQGMTFLDATLAGGHAERGTLQLRAVRIDGDLSLRHARIRNDHGPALRISQAAISGPLAMSTAAIEAGGVNLRDTTVGALHDDPGALPAGVRLRLDGLTYRGIPGEPAARVSVRQRIAWLRRMEMYTAQPYRQLAAAYQAAGHEEEARRLHVAQQQHLRDSGLLTGWARLRHRLLGVTIGYGYQSWRAVAGLLATILVGVVLLLAAGSATGREPAAAGRAAACPAVERIGLAIDTTVPLVDTGSATRCTFATDSTTGQAVLAATWALRLLGWAFATLVVAGYTGLVRRG